MTEETENKRTRRTDRRKDGSPDMQAADSEPAARREPGKRMQRRIQKKRLEPYIRKEETEDEDVEVPDSVKAFLLTCAFLTLLAILTWRAGAAQSAVPGAAFALPDSFWEKVCWGTALLGSALCAARLVLKGHMLLPSAVLFATEWFLLQGKGTLLFIAFMLWLAARSVMAREHSV